MTVLIKYPKVTKVSSEDFFKRKNQELTNLDWAKWAGWFDTDGCMKNYTRKGRSESEQQATLRLRDRQPCELFSQTFETSLYYYEYPTITPEPYRYTYMSKVHAVELNGKKAEWFTKNIFPYLLKEDKIAAAVKVLGHKPESKDPTTWTTAETTHYLATAVEGDGNVSVLGGKNKYVRMRICSSDAQYLSNIRSLTEDKLGLKSNLYDHMTYMTKEGEKTKYIVSICCSRRNPENLPIFKSLLEDNVMTLDRKKQKIQEFVNDIS